MRPQDDKRLLYSDCFVMRHGESTFNEHNLFCGWVDAPLTPRGEEEAREAASLIGQQDQREVDVVFTSRLSRAAKTALLVCEELGADPGIIKHDWRLNEQLYGALTGLNKAQAMLSFGATQVHRWRRGWAEAPPATLMTECGPLFAPYTTDCNMREMLGCDVDEKSYESGKEGTESFLDMSARVADFWSSQVVPELAAGKRVLVVAHGNVLRALVQRLDGLSQEDVGQLAIPRCAPIHYRFLTTGPVPRPVPTPEAAHGAAHGANSNGARDWPSGSAAASAVTWQTRLLLEPHPLMPAASGGSPPRDKTDKLVLGRYLNSPESMGRKLAEEDTQIKKRI
eukprot:CAMPEP_0172591252 /NCGR_PEP_ID=MMETSP1068-20121228/9939_1 /TAXON_ID=35684 /ORGANISM="Pseudopedinella elastica, Strain CCMP716" /LENGTH=338 /DNA_ID=CAMNT_0013387563 /DNA_START=283 /DNA_END=1299 /DNA_ORIENTATION=+